MHLTAVDIVGFKSFSDQTRIEFHQGVTAIVGPNGSGKSNITDAIRWVLGEQSTNELRAGRMVDVVFSGTQSKRAQGFAEVTIHFNNEDGGLPIDFSEVSVTRRFYRSGDSEYEINGAACRLKDIVALFMDTGLGKDGYSIIGQGKVDQILSPKGDERRQIFDEASGIVKYKTRKNDALRKLDQTDKNLVRLDDILGELSLRLVPLEKQAVDARAYLAYAEKLKTLDIWYVDNQLTCHADSINELEKEIDDVTVARQEADQQLAAIRENYETSGQKLADLEVLIEKTRDQHDRLSGEKAGLQADKSRTELAIDHAGTRIEMLTTDINVLQSTVESTHGDDTKQVEKRQHLVGVLTKYKVELKEKRQAFDAAVQITHHAARRKQAINNELDSVRQERFEARSRLVEIETELSHLERRLSEAKHSDADYKGDRSRLSFQLESWQDQLAVAEKEAAKEDAALTTARAELETNRATLLDLQRDLAEVEATASKIDYRVRLLTDLDRQGEGYPGVVRRIEKKRRQDLEMGDGVLGPLAGLLEVKDGYELAIEIALGAAANHIVTTDQATARSWITWLKETRGGRVTFLPIAQMNAWPLDPALLSKAKDRPGYLGTAEEAVRVQADLSAITGRLLGRTLVVDTLNNALDLFNKLNRRVRVVTIDGELLSPGGSVSGGFDQRTGAGVISRKNELKNLARKLADNRKTMADRRQTIKDLQDHQEQLMRTVSSLDKTRLDAVKQVELLTHTVEQGQQSLWQLNKVEAEAAKHFTDLQTRTSERLAAKEKAKTEVENLSQRETDLRQQLKGDPEAEQGREAQLETLRQDLSDLRVNVTSVEETLRSLDEIDQHMKKARAADEKRLEIMKGQRHDQQLSIEKSTEALAKVEKKTRAIQEELDSLAGQVKTKQENRQFLENKRHLAFQALERESQVKSTLLLSLEKLESKRERLENQVDQLKNRLWEQYELVADELSDIRRPDLDNLTPTKAAREISSLRAKIRDLGPVNPAAIDELDEVSSRVDSFAVQRADMEQARNELETVIHDLDLAMKAQFKEGFARIAAAFTQVFRELFNGGDASLELAEDTNLLESDIIIKAQPPGKKMQNLNPLSGGERSLTAIALLFAIMRLRPAPFCVFDEIESSLDDANVLRFADYIRKYSKITQFVLVTHRKGTMESADRLYGVTMQERGVSTILSMQLEKPRVARQQGN